MEDAFKKLVDPNSAVWTEKFDGIDNTDLTPEVIALLHKEIE